MRFRHSVEMQKTLLPASEDWLAVDVIIRIDWRVQDVSGVRLWIYYLDVTFLGQILDPLLVLLGKILAEKQLGHGVKTFGDKGLFSLTKNRWFYVQPLDLLQCQTWRRIERFFKYLCHGNVWNYCPNGSCCRNRTTSVPKSVPRGWVG